LHASVGVVNAKHQLQKQNSLHVWWLYAIDIL